MKTALLVGSLLLGGAMALRYCGQCKSQKKGKNATLQVVCDDTREDTTADEKGSVTSMRTRSGLWIDGLCAATFTPMHTDGSLNLDVIEAQATSLEQQGIRYVFVCGTTGESLSLTTAERMRVVEHWVRAGASHGIKVIVHVGCEALEDDVALAKHAQAVGAAAISAIPPVFFPASSPSNLIEFMAKVAAAAPQLPFYYYHFPAKTNTLPAGMALFNFFVAAASAIPTFHGMKFTDYDFFAASLCARYRDDQGHAFQVLGGKDEVIGAALACGLTGFIGSTYNFAGRLFNDIIRCHKAGDRKGVQLGQARAQEFVQIFLKYSGDNVNAQKALSQLKTGVALGPPRPPFRELSKQDTTAMRTALEAIGFFTWG